jgi:hypothetical protein
VFMFGLITFRSTGLALILPFYLQLSGQPVSSTLGLECITLLSMRKYSP